MTRVPGRLPPALPPATFKVGDVVAWTAAFLRSTGQFTGPAGGERGTYLGLHPTLGTGYCLVRWGSEQEPSAVNEHNLAHPGPNRRFCAVD